MKPLSCLQISLLFILMLGSFATAFGQMKLTGSYTMHVSGKAISEESYMVTLNADGSLQSEADIVAGPSKIHIVTTATRTSPLKFSVTVGNQGLTAEFKAGTAKIAITDQPEQSIKTDATVILENTVWHHFIYLLRQYDGPRGGPQSFKAFLPARATEFGLTVERVEARILDVKGKKIAVEHYRALTSENLALEIWTDSERVPLVISIPLQNLKVIHRGAEDLAERLLPKTAAAAAGNFTAEEVGFNSADVKFSGTLTLPKEGKAPYPAAVIISGSGGQDRDGSLGVFNLYKLVAESLSNAGVAVLRVDDRGVAKSVVADRTRPTSYRDLINDSRAAFDYLAQRSDIDKNRIALVGHSEGAETALTIAAEDSRVAAIVLMAGCSRSADLVVLEQSIFQVALQQTIDPGDQTKLPAVAQAIIQRFEAARVNSKPASTGSDPDSWFREHLASDPSALARRVKCPVLILNGERDRLVLPHHAIVLAETLTASGHKQVSLRIFPDLTHAFTPATIDPNTQKTIEVNSDVLTTVQGWVSKVLRAKIP